MKRRAASEWLWLVSLGYVAASLVLGLLLPKLESTFRPSAVTNVSASSVQALLACIASGMMALTAIVFSIVFVVSQLSSTSYSPRLTAELTRGPLTFHALGIFIGTFTYSLAVLVWIDRSGSAGTPILSTRFAVAMVLLSIVVLVLLIRSLQNFNIVYVMGFIERNGRRSIEELPRRGTSMRGGQSPNAVALPPLSQTIVYTGEPLSLAQYDIDALVAIARRADAVIVLDNAVGDTLVDGSPMLGIYGAAAPLPESELKHAVYLATSRTFRQDPMFAFRLLVDIAIRALSPAVNDPTTAVQALDGIEDLLARLSRRELPSGYVRDESGTLRVLFPAPAWSDFIALAFDEIRQYGQNSVQVMRRLRAVLIRLAGETDDPSLKEALGNYVRRVDDTVAASALDAEDRLTALRADPQGLGVTRRDSPTAQF